MPYFGGNPTGAQLADLDTIQGWLDDRSFRPFGMARWDMGVSAVAGPFVAVRLVHYVPDARAFDHGQEWPDSPMAPQEFVRTMPWPGTDHQRGFIREVLEFAVLAMAHEACEWFVEGPEDRTIHDPHRDGDPHVKLPFTTYPDIKET